MSSAQSHSHIYTHTHTLSLSPSLIQTADVFLFRTNKLPRYSLHLPSGYSFTFEHTKLNMLNCFVLSKLIVVHPQKTKKRYPFLGTFIIVPVPAHTYTRTHSRQRTLFLPIVEEGRRGERAFGPAISGQSFTLTHKKDNKFPFSVEFTPLCLQTLYL